MNMPELATRRAGNSLGRSVEKNTSREEQQSTAECEVCDCDSVGWLFRARVKTPCCDRSRTESRIERLQTFREQNNNKFRQLFNLNNLWILAFLTAAAVKATPVKIKLHMCRRSLCAWIRSRLSTFNRSSQTISTNAFTVDKRKYVICTSFDNNSYNLDNIFWDFYFSSKNVAY